MNPRIALPYLTAPDETVRAEPWRMETLDAVEEYVGEQVSGWDYLRTLRFSRVVELDTESIRRSCLLPVGSTVRLLGSWYSDGTQLRGRGYCVELPLQDNPVREECRFRIAGPMLASKVVLHTDVVLGSSKKRLDLRSPHIPGSRIWSDQKVIQLEGEGSRFPAQAIDFSLTPWIPATGAAWHLAWSPSSLETSYLSAVRLYLNTGHPRVKQAIAENDSTIISALYYDVGRRLVTGALRHAELGDRPEEFHEESLGRALWRLVTSCFPGESVDSLRTLLENEPDRFETRLQESLRLFHD